jgi:phage tail-like protein
MDEQLRNAANPSFRFVVEIDGVRHGAFTECTLPTIEWEIQEVKEGGLNTFVHQLPGVRKRAVLTLKNGLGTGELLQWCIDTMSEQFTRRAVTITLLNVQHEALLNWHVADAYPIKWTAPPLRASENTIAIQTLELACGDIRVEAS